MAKFLVKRSPFAIILCKSAVTYLFLICHPLGCAPFVAAKEEETESGSNAMLTRWRRTWPGPRQRRAHQQTGGGGPQQQDVQCNKNNKNDNSYDHNNNDNSNNDNNNNNNDSDNNNDMPSVGAVVRQGVGS